MEQLNYKDAYYHLFNGISDICAGLNASQGRQVLAVRRQLEQLQRAGEEVCIRENERVISLFPEKA